MMTLIRYWQDRRKKKEIEEHVKPFQDFFEQVSKIMERQMAAYIDTQTISGCRNIYIGLDGTIHPLPFKGGDGLWYFDGQFFYRADLHHG